ncbi:hypothetical protein MF271_23475 (plasmid) [Deinococcus sp. KNUC1210]|uniref:hypothetical protein n=1 Tax=Deinococcus sp. KNUC1210 TaxID=2917691 RepID=UPI001EF0E770|nr:hypothetical protein [Deinococcus sp. KNUC1210]ULH17932.1 hypothetical protein MF271_23475 [Deinococcus sp. KNUC1210]
MVTRRSLIIRSAIRLNVSQIRPWLAVRSTIGVAIPLLVGAGIGHLLWGVVAALGALMAGMASFHGVYRTRLRMMLTASVAMAVSAALGELLSHSLIVTVIGVALLSSFLARFTATPVGSTTVIIQAFTIQTLLMGFPNPQLGLLGTGALVLGGGIIQTLLLIMIWPLNPRRAECNAVAAAFESLLLFVASLSEAQANRLPDVLPLQNAATILTDARHAEGRPAHHVLRQAFQLSEGLHAALVGLASADASLRQTGPAGRETQMRPRRRWKLSSRKRCRRSEKGSSLNFVPLISRCSNTQRVTSNSVFPPKAMPHSVSIFTGWVFWCSSSTSAQCSPQVSNQSPRQVMSPSLHGPPHLFESGTPSCGVMWCASPSR